MAYTLVNARIYVSRIIGGGASSQETLDMADEAILRSYQDWQNKKFWRFLLKDTTNTTTVAAVTVSTLTTTVSAPSSGSFDFVNIGQTVSGTNIAAGTTISSYTRNSDGTVASIVLSIIPTGSGSVTLTFGANIVVTIGVNDYNLPADYNASHSVLLSVAKRTLTWREQKLWDRVIRDQTVRGLPSDYTHYNPYSELTQNYGTPHLKFDRIPDTADVAIIRYYRKFRTTGTNIDVPDDYVYQFLDYARNILLSTKRATEDPAAFAAQVMEAQVSAETSDEEPTDDNDIDNCMKSQYEMGENARPLWGNGDFNATQ